ncbi:MAG: SAM-dependent methyltransferase, partial [Caldilineae bacterium]
MTQLLFTTDPGLEDIVCEEFQEGLAVAELDAGVCQAQPFGRNGHALATHPADMDELWPIAREMRSVHHVLRFVHRFDLPPDQERPEPCLEAIAGGVLQVDIPEMHRAESFRVTANRSGSHPFTSQDVARVAGAALEHHYHCRVDLTGYDVNVRVDVFDETVIVGVQ